MHPCGLTQMPRHTASIVCLYCWRPSVPSMSMYTCSGCRLYACDACKTKLETPTKFDHLMHRPDDFLYRDQLLIELVRERNALIRIWSKCQPTLTCVAHTIAEYARHRLEITRMEHSINRIYLSGNRDMTHYLIEGRQFSYERIDWNDDYDFFEQVWCLNRTQYELYVTL